MIGKCTKLRRSGVTTAAAEAEGGAEAEVEAEGGGAEAETPCCRPGTMCLLATISFTSSKYGRRAAPELTAEAVR